MDTGGASPTVRQPSPRLRSNTIATPRKTNAWTGAPSHISAGFAASARPKRPMTRIQARRTPNQMAISAKALRRPAGGAATRVVVVSKLPPLYRHKLVYGGERCRSLTALSSLKRRDATPRKSSICCGGESSLEPVNGGWICAGGLCRPGRQYADRGGEVRGVRALRIERHADRGDPLAGRFHRPTAAAARPGARRPAAVCDPPVRLRDGDLLLVVHRRPDGVPAGRRGVGLP